MKRTLHRICALFLFLVIGGFQVASAQQSVARRWNELLLQGIREDFARPPVNARNLFHVSMAMYDVWAAYDTTGTAETLFLGKTLGTYFCDFKGVPVPADMEAARRKAISYAAYRILVRRFQLSPNAFATITRFNNYMAELGYDTNNFSIDYANGDPAALGNYIAYRLTFYSMTDGSNEQNNYAIQNYSPVNPPLNMSGSGDPNILDVNHWQPLNLPGAVDQNGNPIPAIQVFQSPEWGRVVPFALKPEDKDTFSRNGIDWYVYHDPGPAPQLDTAANGDPSEEFKWNFSMVASWNAHLDPSDGVMWDISPASIGNNQSPFPHTLDEYKAFYKFNDGGITGAIGRTINPKTGLPYVPEMVPRGDYTRVLAQFWADGPNSETPPGHWFTIINKVMDHPEFVRKFNGKGAVLDTLEYDLKAYLILGGAVHDAAVAAWGIKGWYDTGRPITALRYMAGKGQSSDTMLPNYNAAGVPLIPGLIELVEAGDLLEGTGGANIGKIKFYIWRGFDYIGNPATDFAGVGWILAEDWWPYQRTTFVTPPFAGYISGHSTFSRAAAEALTLLTGDEYFPGGLEEYHIAANSNFLGLEKGPSVDVNLQWATYRDASDETSLSRIWGSIHPPVDDVPGRIIGIECGVGAYNLGKELYYNDLDGDGFYTYEDCDDDNPAIYPGAPEICDGLDNDCDGAVDNGLTITTYYVDADDDGYGDANVSLDTCLIAAPVGFVDNDMDCDDSNPQIHPSATEICDDVDNDCNGFIDDVLTFYTFYIDSDGDGFGTQDSSIYTCISLIPTGFVDIDGDCDDSNPEIHPGATEICDNLDNDCNGMVDDSLTFYTFYIDGDGDGFGTQDSSIYTCISLIPTGFVDIDGDCDDSNPEIHPGAAEICDELDNDCNGFIDDGLTFNTFYFDWDGDGFGAPDSSIYTCISQIPSGFADNDTDCDNFNPDIYPGAPELCDDLDNNCDGAIDEGLPIYTYYTDGDGDGFGNPMLELITCLFPIPISFADNGLDCDDNNPNVNPDAIEILGDGLDNDCNGLVDSISNTKSPALWALAFPNPVRETLSIQADYEGLLHFELANTSGKMVNNGAIYFSAGLATIDFSQMLPGVYILRLFNPVENNLVLLRVIKM